MNSWIRSSIFFVFFAAVVLAPFAEADAALNAYMKLKGQKQGQIKGGVTKKGHEGQIGLTQVSHEIVSPRDAASGLPTGKRQHKPLTITKELDKSTPILNAVLVNNENVPECVLEFYAPGGKGTETLIYTIKLTNASISSIRIFSDQEGNVFEQVSFTYQKIEWTWADGGIMAMDDWQSPSVGSKK